MRNMSLPRVVTQRHAVLEPLGRVLDQHSCTCCCRAIQHHRVLTQHPRVLESLGEVLTKHLPAKIPTPFSNKSDLELDDSLQTNVKCIDRERLFAWLAIFLFGNSYLERSKRLNQM
mgnify:CR=1 FL=1